MAVEATTVPFAADTGKLSGIVENPIMVGEERRSA
jgi:hypothetical protein